MHVNPNMVEPVQAGISMGEQSLDLANADELFQAQLATIDELQAQVGRPTGQFLVAKRIAFAQGFIAAYRSAELPSRCRSGHTDCTVDCGWCKGTGIQGGRL